MTPYPRFPYSTEMRKKLQTVAILYLRSPAACFGDMPEFCRWISSQFTRLPYPVEFVDHEPYRSFDQMKAEVISSGVLRITTSNNAGVLPPPVNLMFRAVHDSDHLQRGPPLSG